jgi:hypothetical protein
MAMNAAAADRVGATTGARTANGVAGVRATCPKNVTFASTSA